MIPKNGTATLVAILALLGPATGLAQERGRTDGAEGSEVGKGGYTPAGGASRFSLELVWGGAFARERVDGGAPLFAGLNAAYWADDWFLVELSGQHLLHNGSTNIYVGPRLRTPFYPISGSIGLKAGGIIVKDVGIRFGISPQIGADLLLRERVMLGLHYALDVPFGHREALAHRLFMSVGYRF
jgi:hypothetical protein